MATLPRRMTYREFVRVTNPGESCELVRGEVIEMSPGGLDHGRSSARIVFALEAWARSSKLGRTFTNEVGLITERDPDSVRGADVVYYSYERLPRASEQRTFSSVPPNLVVEVIGRGQSWANLIEKGGEYLRMGVDRVWLVDAERRTVHVLSKDEPPREYARDSTLSDPAVLPGFEMPVGEMFQD